MKSIGKVLRYIIPYNKYAFLSVIANVLAVIFNLLSILAFIPFLSLLFGDVDPILEKPEFELSSDYVKNYLTYKMLPYMEEQGKEGALLFICLTVGVLFFLKNICRYFAHYFLATIRSGVVHDIRTRVFRKILALPLSFYSEERKGDIISRITGDVQEVEWSIMNSLEMIFRDPIAIVLSLVFMISINPKLTLFSFILLPISGLIIGRIGKSLKRTSSRLQQKMGELLSNVEEALSGLKIIKAFNAESAIDKKFGLVNGLHRRIMRRMYRKRDLASPLSEFLGASVMVTLVWYGGNMVINPEVEFGGEEFIGYMAIFFQLLTPAKSLSTAYYNIQKGIASNERIEKVLNAENRITDRPDAQAINSFEKAIEFKGLSFAYKDAIVLNEINLKVEKGKTIALVGQSGGGKSTLVDLIPRYYDPKTGGVYIDGKDIREYKIKDIRGLMGIVTQQSILFNDTVYSNIALGSENIDKEKVIAAAKIANAHEFIQKLPEGYETNIGDGGGKLSGGQRQRLSIARAVLKNPPIMILDEATSALDTESEKLVQDALNKLMQNRTSIVIAHRLSTIQNADEIIVIHEGEIVERGTHDVLMDQKGIYNKLTKMQAFA